MMKKLSRIGALVRAFFEFFRLVKNPNDLNRVFEISNKLVRPEDLLKMGNHAAERSPRAKASLETRPRVDLKSLYQNRETLKSGSLGFEFLKFLEERNLDPGDIPTLPGQDEADYIQAHLYETHDLWHVLTGFDTDVAGESGLQAFYLAQLPAPLSCVLLAAGLLNLALFEPDDRVARMNQILRGWTLGQKAQQLFGIDWNRQWARPLKEIRQELGLDESIDGRALKRTSSF